MWVGWTAHNMDGRIKAIEKSEVNQERNGDEICHMYSPEEKNRLTIRCPSIDVS
jgi:hypothetical protein